MKIAADTRGRLLGDVRSIRLFSVDMLTGERAGAAARANEKPDQKAKEKALKT